MSSVKRTRRGQDSPELADVLERITRLHGRDQLEVVERVSAWLTRSSDRPSRHAALSQLHRAALDDIEAVYTGLGRPLSERMTAREFNAACKQLGIRSSAPRVAYAWGTWRRAMNVWLGGAPVSSAGYTATQVMSRRRHSGYRDAYASVLEWLRTGPRTTGRQVYTAWAREQNSRLGSADLRHRSGSGVESALGMSFTVVVRDALAGKPAPDLAARAAQEVIRTGGYEFTIATGVARILGHTSRHVLSNLRGTPGFPTVVANLGGSVDLWLVEDIERYMNGKDVPDRTEGELQHVVLGWRSVAERLGITPRALKGRLQERRLAPPPDGRLANMRWWDGARLEQWISDHPGYVKDRDS